MLVAPAVPTYIAYLTSSHLVSDRPRDGGGEAVSEAGPAVVGSGVGQGVGAGEVPLDVEAGLVQAGAESAEVGERVTPPQAHVGRELPVPAAEVPGQVGEECAGDLV